MSECSGPQTGSDPMLFDNFDSKESFQSTGAPMPGTDILIFRPDKDGNGEICYKGRNRFMGYY